LKRCSVDDSEAEMSLVSLWVGDVMGAVGSVTFLALGKWGPLLITLEPYARSNFW